MGSLFKGFNSADNTQIKLYSAMQIKPMCLRFNLANFEQVFVKLTNQIQIVLSYFVTVSEQPILH